MNELSLFTGAGGGLLGTHLLGWRPVGYVEWNDYCQRVIAARIRDGILPAAPIFTDVREFAQSGAADQYRGIADVVTAGFPCQPFSSAGNQLGADDERNMWPATADVIRRVRPRLAHLENVAALIASGYIGVVLADLAALGYDATWDCIPAAQFGHPHFRDRTWITAYSHGQPRPEQNEWEKARFAASRRSDASGLDLAQRRAREAPAIFRGMDDEFSHRLDRLKALGNAQVGGMAGEAFTLLSNE